MMKGIVEDPLRMDERLQAELIKVDRLPHGNAKIIREFLDDYCFRNAGSKATWLKNAARLRECAVIFGKSLDKINRTDTRNPDARTFFTYHRETGKNPTTTLKVLRCFLKWHDPKGNAALLVSGEFQIPKAHRKRVKVDPNSIPTNQDVEYWIRHITSPYVYALAAFYADVGARLSEPLYCNVEDFRPDENGASINLPHGKTGQRVVRATWSTPIITEYLNKYHPEPRNKKAPLFVSQKGQRWTQDSISSLFEKYNRIHPGRVKIMPQVLRRKVATELLARVSQGIAEKQLGWRPGTDVVKHYSGISNEEVAAQIDALRGGREVAIKRGEILESKKCLKCGKESAPHYAYSPCCGLPFDKAELLSLESAQGRELKNLRMEIEEMRAMLEILSHKEMHEPKQRKQLMQDAAQWKKKR